MLAHFIKHSIISKKEMSSYSSNDIKSLLIYNACLNNNSLTLVYIHLKFSQDKNYLTETDTLEYLSNSKFIGTTPQRNLAMSLHIPDYLSVILLITTIVVFNMFYYSIKSLLLGKKSVLRHQDLQRIDLKLNKYEKFSATRSFGSR